MIKKKSIGGPPLEVHRDRTKGFFLVTDLHSPSVDFPDFSPSLGDCPRRPPWRIRSIEPLPSRSTAKHQEGGDSEELSEGLLRAHSVSRDSEEGEELSDGLPR